MLETYHTMVNNARGQNNDSARMRIAGSQGPRFLVVSEKSKKQELSNATVIYVRSCKLVGMAVSFSILEMVEQLSIRSRVNVERLTK